VRITRARLVDAGLDLLPGLMVFVLLIVSPPPREVVPWVTMAYSPLLLWALIRKADGDSQLFGMPLRRRRGPTRAKDVATQVALVALLVLFVDWPF
jgi:hypothetical protein